MVLLAHKRESLFISNVMSECQIALLQSEKVPTNESSHIKPGGWIEQFEMSGFVECDDKSLPDDSVLRTWGPRLALAAEKSGRPLGTMHTMRSSIESAGFTDIHVKEYKLPIGPWAKDKHLKEVGVVNYEYWRKGMEGFAMWLLTRFGDPSPWTMESVLVYVAHMRHDFANTSYHTYSRW